MGPARRSNVKMAQFITDAFIWDSLDHSTPLRVQSRQAGWERATVVIPGNPVRLVCLAGVGSGRYKQPSDQMPDWILERPPRDGHSLLCRSRSGASVVNGTSRTNRLHRILSPIGCTADKQGFRPWPARPSLTHPERLISAGNASLRPLTWRALDCILH